MNDRERLIEERLIKLLRLAPHEDRKLCNWIRDDSIKKIADHLIANGVTVQKHGRWITVNGVIRCSECNARINYEKEQGGCFFPDESRHCPNCGAKMIEGKEE